jgi:hypothetical protein
VKKKLIPLAASLGVLLVVTAASALAQTEPGNGVQGSITGISGNVVLVKEKPADELGSGKGAFTVTDETEILRQQGNEQVPATFDDLQIGQLVAAEYTGPVAETYPTQGTAGSIVILENPPADEPIDEDELLCLLPEGCDTDGDGVPDLVAGEPVSGEEMSSGGEQYNAT